MIDERRYPALTVDTATSERIEGRGEIPIMMMLLSSSSSTFDVRAGREQCSDLNDRKIAGFAPATVI
jgi:hypothetical protein